MTKEEHDTIFQAWRDRKRDYLESLTVKLRAALEEWATENDEQPGFWHVSNAVSYAREEAEKIVAGTAH
jgi:hypothetical protein